MYPAAFSLAFEPLTKMFTFKKVGQLEKTISAQYDLYGLGKLHIATRYQITFQIYFLINK